MKSITVPFQIINLQDNGFHILVETVVFEQQGFIVIDTGASRSVFDQTFLEQNNLNLIADEEQQASTIFSTNQPLIGIIPLLKIGKLTIPNYETVALDLQGVSATYVQLGQPPIMGILGGDILVKYNCKIEYKKQLIRFYY